MSFDLAAHQRDRIRCLERETRGLEAERDQLVRVLAGVIVDYEARLWARSLSQDEFMAVLASSVQSRSEGSFRKVASPSKVPPTVHPLQ